MNFRIVFINNKDIIDLQANLFVFVTGRSLNSVFTLYNDNMLSDRKFNFQLFNQILKN